MLLVAPAQDAGPTGIVEARHRTLSSPQRGPAGCPSGGGC